MKYNFTVMKKTSGGFANTDRVLTGASPSKVAQKLARRGEKTIYIRKNNTKIVREYKGSIKQTTLKSDTPFKRAGEKVDLGVVTFVQSYKI